MSGRGIIQLIAICINVNDSSCKKNIKLCKSMEENLVERFKYLPWQIRCVFYYFVFTFYQHGNQSCLHPMPCSICNEYAEISRFQFKNIIQVAAHFRHRLVYYLHIYFSFWQIMMQRFLLNTAGHIKIFHHRFVQSLNFICFFQNSFAEKAV